MTQAQQPEALRLAERLTRDVWGCTPMRLLPIIEQSAAELRRLHARVQEQAAQLARKVPTKQELADYLMQQDAVIVSRLTYEGMRAAAGHPAPAISAAGKAYERLIAAKDELYRSRIGLRCSHCNTGSYRADGNGYYEFHRCDNCRYVPMWCADGKEFGVKTEQGKEPWHCLLCKSDRPGVHGLLDDRTTPCPEGVRFADRHHGIQEKQG